MKHQEKGFSLVELMIVIAVVAILVTLSYPSYISFIRKAERTDAQVELLDWANRQQVWRADHITYNADINPANTDNYVFTMASTATSFTLTATAQDGQASDAEDGTNCASLTLNQVGIQGANLVCWE